MTGIGIYYVCIIIYLIVGGFLYMKTKKEKADKYIMIVAFLIFGSVMAFRSPYVGTDTYAYCNIFIQNSQMTLPQLLQTSNPGYAVYSKLLSLISVKPQWIIIANSLTIVGLICFFIFKTSKQPFFSWYLFITGFYYFYAMNAARQFIAIAMICVGYYFLTEKKYWRAILMLLLAVSFHYTAIVAILIYVIYFFKASTTTVALFSMFAYIVAANYQWGINTFVRIFPNYVGYVYSIVGGNYVSDGGRLPLGLFYIAFILVFIILYFMRGRTANENMTGIFKLAMVVSVSIISMFIFRYSDLFSRLEHYFSVFVIIFIPNLIDEAFDRKSKRLLTLAVGLVMLIPWYIRLKGADDVPYTVFWQNPFM